MVSRHATGVVKERVVRPGAPSRERLSGRTLRQADERIAALEAELRRKTEMLREVDHRVKNNLQVISSLMLLKTRRTPEGETRDALQAMAERVGALAAVHRLLYSVDESVRLNIQDFASELLGDLLAGVDTSRISVAVDFEAITVSATMAAPLALLVHELATNAIRHAFPGDRAGRLWIAGIRRGDTLHIRVEDDGVGQGTPRTGGFGRSLIDMVVRQLRGTIAWSDAQPGTRAEVVVPLDEAIR
ncbi:MAG: sensor histidine kinase [Methylobacterium sp.]|nr:sensor histidine kinase [Methylobacterium sp.]